MLQLYCKVEDCPSELRDGLVEIMRMHAGRFADDAAATPLTFAQDAATERSFRIMRDAGGLAVKYARVIDAFRALGHLLGADVAGSYTETAALDMVGIMVDVSRNGVLTPGAARELLRYCALMGINTFMLYSEDTYEVPGEPFFGYLRGRYT